MTVSYTHLKMEVSIDEPLNVDWDGNELLLSDILGTDEDVIYRGIESEVERSLLGKAIGKLTKREQTIVRLRFGINMPDGREKTQKEVADLLGKMCIRDRDRTDTVEENSYG